MTDFLYVTSSTLIINLLLFITFWKFPDFKRKTAFFLICINVLVKTLFFSGLFFQISNIRRTEIIFSLISALIYLLCVRISVFQILFYYCLILDFISVARGLSAYFSVYLFSLNTLPFGRILLLMLFYILLFPFTLLYFRRITKLLTTSGAQFLWRIIWLIPAANTSLVLLHTNAYNAKDAGSSAFFITRMILLASSLAICLVLLYTLENIVRTTVLKEQVKYDEQILKLQQLKYAEQQEHMDEIRHMRHDLRQHLRIMQGYLSEGNFKALQEYIDTYSLSLPSAGAVRYCKNQALNTLLNYYGEKAASTGIRFECEIDLPETTSVTDPDLCVIFGNLLENAVEACGGQKAPYVHAAAGLSGKRSISLIVDNTAPSAPVVKNEAFLSGKHEGYGIGTQSVRAVASRYNGTASFEWKEGRFQASVLLNPAE